MGKIISRISLLPKTDLNEENLHSIIISFVRGIAAIEVAITHLRNQFLPDYKIVSNPTIAFKALVFGTGFAHQAVMLFFVISGWLVGGSLLNKLDQSDTFKTYVIDRTTRLWTVLIPAFFLSIVCAVFTGGVQTDQPPDYLVDIFSPIAFVGNLFGLQTLTFHGMVFPTYGGNFPLWSLSNETWYYILFPLLLLTFRTGNMATRTCAAIAAMLITVALPLSIVSYFSLWLLGVLFSRIKIDGGAMFSICALAVFLSFCVFFRVTNNTTSLSVDFLSNGTFLVFLSSVQYKSKIVTFDKIKPIGHFLANLSFSLYVSHVTFIGVAVFLFAKFSNERYLTQSNPWHLVAFFLISISIVSFAYLFYLAFESRTYVLRRIVKQRLLTHAAPLPVL